MNRMGYSAEEAFALILQNIHMIFFISGEIMRLLLENQQVDDLATHRSEPIYVFEQTLIMMIETFPNNLISPMTTVGQIMFSMASRFVVGMNTCSCANRYVNLEVQKFLNKEAVLRSPNRMTSILISMFFACRTANGIKLTIHDHIKHCIGFGTEFGINFLVSVADQIREKRKVINGVMCMRVEALQRMKLELQEDLEMVEEYMWIPEQGQPNQIMPVATFDPNSLFHIQVPAGNVPCTSRVVPLFPQVFHIPQCAPPQLRMIRTPTPPREPIRKITTVAQMAKRERLIKKHVRADDRFDTIAEHVRAVMKRIQKHAMPGEEIPGNNQVRKFVIQLRSGKDVHDPEGSATLYKTRFDINASGGSSGVGCSSLLIL